MEYVRSVSRISAFARSYGLEALVAIAALEGMLDVAFRDDALRAPRTTPWLAVPIRGASGRFAGEAWFDCSGGLTGSVAPQPVAGA